MKRFFNRYVLHNFWTKLFSVLIAVFTWSAIMHSSDPYITVTVKNVQVAKNNETAVTGENMIYDVVSGENVNVTLYGPRSEVQELSADDINAYVNLKELSITNSCPIHVEFKDKDKAKNVKVSSKSSEVMILSLENMVTESRQVVCVMTGSPATGYYATASVNPATIEIYGSENAVSNVGRVIATVDISGSSETFTTEVDVSMLDADSEVINSSSVTIQNSKVEVTVDIYRTKNININIDADISAMKGFVCDELRYAPDTIAIAGPPAAINSITEITLPFVKNDINETVNENIILSDYIPENCYLVSDTDFISLTIPVLMLSENRKFDVRLSDIDTSSLPSDFKIENSSESFEVSVWGVEGTTDELNIRDLALYLDLEGVTEAGSIKVALLSRTEKDLMFDDAEIELDIVKIEPVSDDDEPLEGEGGE